MGDEGVEPGLHGASYLLSHESGNNGIWMAEATDGGCSCVTVPGGHNNERRVAQMMPTLDYKAQGSLKKGGDKVVLIPLNTALRNPVSSATSNAQMR
jgi:hypothetical protein